MLIEYPAQRGVHRMRGCEVAAEPAVHHDYRALTQFGGVDLIDERIEQWGRRGEVIQRPARVVQPGGIHQSVLGDHEEFRGDPGVRGLGFGPCRCGARVCANLSGTSSVSVNNLSTSAPPIRGYASMAGLKYRWKISPKKWDSCSLIAVPQVSHGHLNCAPVSSAEHEFGQDGGLADDCRCPWS